MKYLIITEDAEIYFSDTLPEEVIVAVDEGIWQVVDISTGKELLPDGVWETIAPLDLSQFILPEDGE